MELIVTPISGPRSAPTRERGLVQQID